LGRRCGLLFPHARSTRRWQRVRRNGSPLIRPRRVCRRRRGRWVRFRTPAHSDHLAEAVVPFHTSRGAPAEQSAEWTDDRVLRLLQSVGRTDSSCLLVPFGDEPSRVGLQLHLSGVLYALSRGPLPSMRPETSHPTAVPSTTPSINSCRGTTPEAETCAG
jgi:hypothetical protein